MLFDRFKQVKAFVFAVDGVLAGGTTWLTESGEQLHRTASRDDYALRLALDRKYPIALTSDRNLPGIKRRMEVMGMQCLFVGGGDKTTAVRDWLSSEGLAVDDVLYMGSDIPDVGGMLTAGFPTCPADAVEEVKAIAAYISFCEGGNGAVRDVIEKVMKLQGLWK